MPAQGVNSRGWRIRMSYPFTRRESIGNDCVLVCIQTNVCDIISH